MCLWRSLGPPHLSNVASVCILWKPAPRAYNQAGPGCMRNTATRRHPEPALFLLLLGLRSVMPLNRATIQSF